MKQLTAFSLFATVLFAMPPGPAFNGPEPFFPAGVEVPGPNKLAGFDYCETVTILMQFPDNRADTLARPAALFDSMLYSTGVYNGQRFRAGSLNDFFLENSYGVYDVRGAIAGNRWFLSQYNYSRYYDGNYMLSTGGQLARENLQQVDAVIDFRQFDFNQDGHIDAMFMVHAGADGADNGNVNCCWSHAIPYFNYTTNDGVVIDGVTNVPEFAMVTEARETTMCCIAVMCHELGHLADHAIGRIERDHAEPLGIHQIDLVAGRMGFHTRKLQTGPGKRIHPCRLPGRTNLQPVRKHITRAIT